MDGCSRQNPAYRPATEEPRSGGAFLWQLRERRQRVLVVTPAGSTVLRTLQLVEFSRAAPLHDSLAEALAELDAGAVEPA